MGDSVTAGAGIPPDPSRIPTAPDEGAIAGGSSPGAVHTREVRPHSETAVHGVADADLRAPTNPKLKKGPSADMKHIKKGLYRQLRNAGVPKEEALARIQNMEVTARHGSFKDNGYGFYCTTTEYVFTVPGVPPAEFVYHSEVDLWVSTSEDISTVQGDLSTRIKAHITCQTVMCKELIKPGRERFLKTSYGIQATSRNEDTGRIEGQSRGSRGSRLARAWAWLPKTSKAGSASEKVISLTHVDRGVNQAAQDVIFHGAMANWNPPGVGEEPNINVTTPVPEGSVSPLSPEDREIVDPEVNAVNALRGRVDDVYSSSFDESDLDDLRDDIAARREAIRTKMGEVDSGSAAHRALGRQIDALDSLTAFEAVARVSHDAGEPPPPCRSREDVHDELGNGVSLFYVDAETREPRIAIQSKQGGRADLPLHYNADEGKFQVFDVRGNSIAEGANPRELPTQVQDRANAIDEQFRTGLPRWREARGSNDPSRISAVAAQCMANLRGIHALDQTQQEGIERNIGRIECEKLIADVRLEQQAYINDLIEGTSAIDASRFAAAADRIDTELLPKLEELRGSDSGEVKGARQFRDQLRSLEPQLAQARGDAAFRGVRSLEEASAGIGSGETRLFLDRNTLIPTLVTADGEGKVHHMPVEYRDGHGWCPMGQEPAPAAPGASPVGIQALGQDLVNQMSTVGALEQRLATIQAAPKDELTNLNTQKEQLETLKAEAAAILGGGESADARVSQIISACDHQIAWIDGANAWYSDSEGTLQVAFGANPEQHAIEDQEVSAYIDPSTQQLMLRSRDDRFGEPVTMPVTVDSSGVLRVTVDRKEVEADSLAELAEKVSQNRRPSPPPRPARLTETELADVARDVSGQFAEIYAQLDHPAGPQVPDNLEDRINALKTQTARLGQSESPRLLERKAQFEAQIRQLETVMQVDDRLETLDEIDGRQSLEGEFTALYWDAASHQVRMHNFFRESATEVAIQESAIEFNSSANSWSTLDAVAKASDGAPQYIQANEVGDSDGLIDQFKQVTTTNRDGIDDFRESLDVTRFSALSDPVLDAESIGSDLEQLRSIRSEIEELETPTNARLCQELYNKVDAQIAFLSAANAHSADEATGFQILDAGAHIKALPVENGQQGVYWSEDDDCMMLVSRNDSQDTAVVRSRVEVGRTRYTAADTGNHVRRPLSGTEAPLVLLQELAGKLQPPVASAPPAPTERTESDTMLHRELTMQFGAYRRPLGNSTAEIVERHEQLNAFEARLNEAKESLSESDFNALQEGIAAQRTRVADAAEQVIAGSAEFIARQSMNQRAKNYGLQLLRMGGVGPMKDIRRMLEVGKECDADRDWAASEEGMNALLNHVATAAFARGGELIPLLGPCNAATAQTRLAEQPDADPKAGVFWDTENNCACVIVQTARPDNPTVPVFFATKVQSSQYKLNRGEARFAIRDEGGQELRSIEQAAQLLLSRAEKQFSDTATFFDDLEKDLSELELPALKDTESSTDSSEQGLDDIMGSIAELEKAASKPNPSLKEVSADEVIKEIDDFMTGGSTTSSSDEDGESLDALD